jgi:CubicO group peptidase (beta-lactamase class C family)
MGMPLLPTPRTLRLPATALFQFARLACWVGLAFTTACAGADRSGAPTAPPIEPPPVSVDPRTLAPYFPPTTGAPWDTIAGARLGYDTAALTAALDWVGTQRSTAVLVLWRGRIVAERYWNGWTPTKDSIIASAGKSVLSAITGELARSGRLSLDSTAARYLGTGWSRSPGTESRITVRHLLGMMSGLNDSLRTVVQPGTRFYYNNPAYYQLFGVVQAVSRESINALSRRVLFDRIGMSGSTWLPNVDTGELGWVLSSTARDMARFGLLSLNRGRWNGVTVLADSAWFAASWRATPPDNAGYGLLWWLNGSSSYRTPGPYLLPSQSGPLIPSAPADLVAALGKGDKKIYVVPSLELVVVRHGEEADASGSNPLAVSAFDEQWWRKLKLAFRY